jgi:hypothetical protein
VAQVPVGDAFSVRQADQIRHAIASARAETGLAFSVYIGPTEGDVRNYALRLHALSGADGAVAVLTLIDPEVRRVEVVTGNQASRWLDDRSAALASLSMATSFAGGDLVGGIVNGLRMMTSAAARPRALHEPD